ncbi:MAG: hypothetical protein ACKO96_27580, partial [Flammeovirgaceae bacterium]
FPTFQYLFWQSPDDLKLLLFCLKLPEILETKDDSLGDKDDIFFSKAVIFERKDDSLGDKEVELSVLRNLNHIFETAEAIYEKENIDRLTQYRTPTRYIQLLPSIDFIVVRRNARASQQNKGNW